MRYNDEKLTVIGRKYGVSRERIRQIQVQAESECGEFLKRRFGVEELNDLSELLQGE